MSVEEWAVAVLVTVKYREQGVRVVWVVAVHRWVCHSTDGDRSV